MHTRRNWPPWWILNSLFPHQTLIHLIDRKTGKEMETKFYTGSIIIYHHVNAYEEDDHLVFDVIAYKDNKLYDMFYLSKLKENTGKPDENYSKPSYNRYVLPLISDKVGAGGHMWWLCSYLHFDLFQMWLCRALQLERTWWSSQTQEPLLWRRKKANCCASQRCSAMVKPPTIHIS